MGLAASRSEQPSAYQRHRPETTALYDVVRDNLETLYGAIADGALDVQLPKHAELQARVERLHATADTNGFGSTLARCSTNDCETLWESTCTGRANAAAAEAAIL